MSDLLIYDFMMNELFVVWPLQGF
uniref:Uncharacterized protein n=1 Tax=Rhizophora mucronata TaxID=61149 RepID=A0A2P2PYM9_RHIMU